jgi:hypothetical protein
LFAALRIVPRLDVGDAPIVAQGQVLHVAAHATDALHHLHAELCSRRDSVLTRLEVAQQIELDVIDERGIDFIALAVIVDVLRDGAGGRPLEVVERGIELEARGGSRQRSSGCGISFFLA